MVEQFDALTPFLTLTPTALRLIILVWHRNDLKYVLDYLENAFVNGKELDINFMISNTKKIQFTAKEKREIEINARANQVSSILLAVLVVLALLCITFFFISPVIRDLTRVRSGLERMYNIPFKAT